MAILGIHLKMLIGATAPVIAPLALNEALQSVEVTHSDRGSSGFQLSFQIGRGLLDFLDYSLVRHPLLKPFNRVILLVFFNLTRHVLMDGIITDRQVSPSNDPGDSMLTVTGEDISVMMDMEEVPREHPGMSENLIVTRLMQAYVARFGLIPDIHPPPDVQVPDPLQGTPQQGSNYTDRGYIKMLAERFGYVFYTIPGPAPGSNRVYWGPPVRLGVPQKALSVNMGPNTNVDSISFRYDALAPNKVIFRTEQGERTIERPSADRIPLTQSRAELARTIYLSDTGRLTTEQLQVRAQGMVDKSLDEVITATGELNALRYGELLQPRGIVGLRGAGKSYDGAFYVKSVTHRINAREGEYKQGFTLTREGEGTLTPFLPP